MAAPFPHHYEVDLAWEADRHGTLMAPPRPSLAGGPPPEFDGRPERWSPEHLLLSSVNLCQMTTFLALAGKARLPIAGYRSRAEGTLDKTEAGIVFTSIAMRVELQVAAAEVERAEQLLHTSKKHCIVSNSLKPPVTLDVSVTAKRRENV